MILIGFVWITKYKVIEQPIKLRRYNEWQKPNKQQDVQLTTKTRVMKLKKEK